MIFGLGSKVDFSKFQKILIVRQDRLGDLILSLPLSTHIKQYNPKAIVHILVPEYTRAVAEMYRDIDKTLILPPPAELKNNSEALVQKLKEENYDLAIVPNTKSYIAEILVKSGIPWRIGQGLRWHGWKYNLPVFQNRKRPDRNELDYNFDLLSRWIPVPVKTSVTFPFIPEDEAEKKIEEFLSSHTINKFSIIHPGSGGSAIDVSPEVLGEIAGLGILPGRVLITGTQSEKDIAHTVLKQSGGNALNVAGMFSIPELMSLIRRCDFFMGNSTGPLHIARAFERPLLGFYSTFPACHPKRWGPYGIEKEHTFLPPGESFDTFENNKAQSRKHMEKIRSQEVLEKIREILSKP